MGAGDRTNYSVRGASEIGLRSIYIHVLVVYRSWLRKKFIVLDILKPPGVSL